MFKEITPASTEGIVKQVETYLKNKGSIYNAENFRVMFDCESQKYVLYTYYWHLYDQLMEYAELDFIDHGFHMNGDRRVYQVILPVEMR